jgi:hypothetical protein
VTSIAEKAEREVRALHETFVELFTGRSEDYGRCAAALASDFWMITPDGLRLGRDHVLEGIATAAATDDFRISIHGFQVVAEFPDSVLLHYIEEQYRNSRTTRRLSTALFTADAGAPQGVLWRYLHETWMGPTTEGIPQGGR